MSRLDRISQHLNGPADSGFNFLVWELAFGAAALALLGLFS